MLNIILTALNYWGYFDTPRHRRHPNAREGGSGRGGQSPNPDLTTTVDRPLCISNLIGHRATTGGLRASTTTVGTQAMATTAPTTRRATATTAEGRSRRATAGPDTGMIDGDSHSSQTDDNSHSHSSHSPTALTGRHSTGSLADNPSQRAGHRHDRRQGRTPG